VAWTPPDRPEWVVAANAGRIESLRADAKQPLDFDTLVGEAAARQGLIADSAAAIEHAFGHPDFPADPALDRLRRFLVALDEEANLHLLGRIMARRFLLRLLEVRIQLMNYLHADPGVQEEIIANPVIVAGAPRTGTTILHELLAADPRHRVPEGWELLRPVPPPSPDPARFAADPRIALADRELVAPQTVVSGLLSIHAYSGRMPKECLSAWSYSFLSEELTARFRVPSFEAYVTGTDPRDAYRMHHLVLQVLQRGHGPTAWVLKSPVHLHALPTLFAEYPDARVAISHRDPLALLASLTSLIANLRWAHSDAVDATEIGRGHVDRYARTFERLVDWTETRAIPAEATHHSRFADFQNAPIETVRALYARFGLTWDEATRAALEGALDASPADRHGVHRYDIDDLGADAEALNARFARYRQAFDVPAATPA